MLEVHLITHDAEEMLLWALRHYVSLPAKVLVYDGGPTGRISRFKTTEELCKFYGATWVPFDTKGQLNDQLHVNLKNTCWKGTSADWVACCDADELLWWPEGMERTLSLYESFGAAIIRPSGFEMFSETLPTGQGLITDQIKHGAPDDKWYGKPILFSPRRVIDTGFGIGAHDAHPTLLSGKRVKVNLLWPKATPPTFLLHYHSGIGPVDRVADRYAATRKRLSEVNILNRWGNFDNPMKHAKDKRAFILANLRKVID